MQVSNQTIKTRDLVGQYCRHTGPGGCHLSDQVETYHCPSTPRLEFLNPDNLSVRTAAHGRWEYAYQLQGDRAAASQAYTEALYQPGDRAYHYHHNGYIGLGTYKKQKTSFIWRMRPTGEFCS